MVVDLTVRVNNQDINYQKIPASSELADFGNGNIVLSDNRNAMNSEIMSLKQKSLNIINSIDQHKELIANYDKMLSGLNPEFAEKQQQQAEINELKMQVNDLTKGIADLMKMNKDLLAQFKNKK
jgi:chromosome segregation ATPase